jgi:hypothetical protein
MNRIYESGAKKRKTRMKAQSRDAEIFSKMPKLSTFFGRKEEANNKMEREGILGLCS